MIALVTDSTCDLPDKIINNYNINVVPLTVHFGEDSYYDKQDLDTDQFYTLMESSSELPRTSQPSTGLFLEKYEELAKEYDQIVSIHISAALSGTCESARLAAAHLENAEVEVIDSRTTSTGLGFLLIKAAELIEDGKSLVEIKNTIIEEREKVAIYFTVSELSYLEKGGRIGKAQAFLGSVLNFNPILELSSETGEVIPKEKIRGYKKTNKKIVELVSESIEDCSRVNISYIFGKDSDNYLQLKELINDFIINKAELNLNIMENRIGTVLSSHTGPLVYGVVIYKGELSET
ncbi:MAG: DegV family protein [Halanaerobium sp.]